ncbi:putative reverse transcriptase domain-containing protein [Tanacetum coccineum]
MPGSMPPYIKTPINAMSSYARAMIELRANMELRDNIMMTMTKFTREGFYTCNIRVEYEWKPPRCACCKVFGHFQEECPRNIGAGETKSLKKPSQTPAVFGDLGTNEGTLNLACQEANSSGSSFSNVNSSSSSTTLIIKKIDKIEKLIIDGKVTLMDDEVKPLEKVESSRDYDNEDEVALVDNEMASFFAKKDGYGTNSLLEQWKESYENDDYDYDPYDDDMYEGQEIPDKLQSICDNLDIKVRGCKKK